METKTFNTIEEEFTYKFESRKNIFYDILETCGNQFDIGTGSYLFDGRNYEYCDKMFKKQVLLFDKVKNIDSVLEIGSYMGHSAFIMLLSNPNLKITCIDIDDTYSQPSINLLNEIFDSRVTFIKGDSLSVLNTLTEKFDFFHIDGAHTIDYVRREFDLCKNLSSSDIMEVIFDDYDNVTEMNSFIERNHKILEQSTPNCDWRNSYLKIKL